MFIIGLIITAFLLGFCALFLACACILARRADKAGEDACWSGWEVD